MNLRPDCEMSVGENILYQVKKKKKDIALIMYKEYGRESIERAKECEHLSEGYKLLQNAE